MRIFFLLLGIFATSLAVAQEFSITTGPITDAKERFDAHSACAAELMRSELAKRSSPRTYGRALLWNANLPGFE